VCHQSCVLGELSVVNLVGGPNRPLRKLVGPRTLISPGARAIIRDKQGDVLLVRRSDNGTWSMPAGSMELNESILNCLMREVWEETGLEVLEATPIALYTEPRFAFTTAFGL